MLILSYPIFAGIGLFIVMWLAGAIDDDLIDDWLGRNRRNSESSVQSVSSDEEEEEEYDDEVEDEEDAR